MLRHKLFLIVACVVSVAFVFALKMEKLGQQDDNYVVKIAYPFIPETTRTDPREIEWSYEEDFASNLFGRLLTISDDNQLLTDIPDKLVVKERTATFIFGKTSRTHTGHVLTAQDAEMSLKRLFVGGRPKFSWLKEILCGESEIRRVDSHCAGLRSSDNELTVQTKSSSELSLVLRAFSKAEFGILSSEFISPINGNLGSGYAEDSSGPFSLASSQDKTRFVLLANSGSKSYSAKMPSRIELVAMLSPAAISAFLSREIDILPMSIFWSNEAAKSILFNERFNSKETLRTRVSVIQFNSSAFKDFDAQSRIFFGDKIAAAASALHPQVGAVKTVQFLQQAGDGDLSGDMLLELENRRNSRPAGALKRQIVFGVVSKDFADMKSLLKDYPEIEVRSYPSHPGHSAQKDWPDAMTMSADVSGNDQVSLITSYLDSNLYVPKLDQKRWLKTFVQERDNQTRDKLLQTLHYEALRNGSIVPNVATPFYAASQKNIHFAASKTQATMDMWTIRRD